MKNLTKTDHARACVDYIFDNEAEDFSENPSKDHIYFSALCYSFGKRKAEKILNETLEESSTTCIKCGKLMGLDQTEDYEFWPTHLECLGPYDAWIDLNGESLHKRGFEDHTRAEKFIAENYAYSKHTLIKKVR